MFRSLVVVAMVSVLVGCAAPVTRTATGTSSAVDAETQLQREMALKQLLEDNKRAHALYFRIRTAAADMCGKDVVGLSGMMINTARDTEQGRALQRIIGMGTRPIVWAVHDGGPAKSAGIQEGDIVLQVNDTPITDIKQISERISALPPGSSYEIALERNGERRKTTVVPTAGCKYDLAVSGRQEINAYADGQRIIITQGMSNFARTDEELSLVLAHELAHNVMKHLDSKRANAAGGLLADVALAVLTRGAYRDPAFSNAASQAYSQEFEAEADYVGMYMMAKAGMSIDDAPKFWRRMAVAHPANIKSNHSASHPSTASRMVSLEATVKEIKEKLAKGEPLEPNAKEGKFVSPAAK